MAQHKNLPNSELHEPKDINTATADTVYVADGAGSGDWKSAYTTGWEVYEDVTTGSSAIALTLASTFYDLTNDGAGSGTNTTYRLPGFSAIWDTTNNQFEWSDAGMAVGDTVDIEIDTTVTVDSTSQEIQMNLDMAHGTGSEYSIPLTVTLLKSATGYRVIGRATIVMKNSTDLTNPAKVSMSSDSTGDTVVVNTITARITPIQAVYN